jgi:predicted MPP superfamily phosphohydrolase
MSLKSSSLLSRRNFMMLGGLGVLGAAGGLGAARFEAGWQKTTFKEISGLHLGRPLRVLHLSDFHASWCVSWEKIYEAVRHGMAQKPDIVVLTGDYVTSSTDDISGYADALSPLRDFPHCYACLGNHDGKYLPQDSRARQIETEMGKSGVRFLVNRHVVVEVSGQLLRIAGLGDIWRHEAKPWECLLPIGSDGPPTLLLSHNPDSKLDVKDYAWDVMFSGHTHGGQFRVPLINWAPILPVNDRSMVEGVYGWKGRKIHITRGVGCLHGIRLFCPPEISIVDLS